MRCVLPLLLLVAGPAVANPAENLDRDAISEGVGKVRDKVLACGSGLSVKGTVKVAVEVAPSGSVTAATIKETPDKALGDCVAGVIKGATFRQTIKGGSFSYPFVFVPDIAEELDRAAIADGVAKVKAQVVACGASSKAKGQVKVKVEVLPAGDVKTVEVVATPDPALGACVAGAIQKATFKKTTKGGTFSYPFVF